MKKLLLALILLLINIPLFSQEWYRDYDLEEFLYDEWYVEIEVWVIDWDDGTSMINFEDVYSEDWFDVRMNLSTLLYAIYDEAEWEGFDYSDLDIYLIIYSWFEYDDPEDPNARYLDEDLRWDIYLDEEWMTRYFNARRDRDRTTMVGRIIDVMVAQWEEQNNFFLRRDITPYSDDIEEQRQLEEQTPLQGK